MSNLTRQGTDQPSLPLTQALGRFVADIRFDHLPGAAVETARLGFTDCIATMIAGSPEPAVQILKKTLPDGRGGQIIEPGARDEAPERLRQGERRLIGSLAREV